MYRSEIKGKYISFSNVFDWFKAYGHQELNLSENYYLDIKFFGKALFIAIREKETNKLVKMIYKNIDITNNFTKAYDGLYYSKAWSKNNDKIIVDGLGWTIEQVREYMLDSEVLNDIKSNYETLIDNIRYVTA